MSLSRQELVLEDDEHLIVEIPQWHTLCFKPTEFGGKKHIIVLHDKWMSGTYFTLNQAIDSSLRFIELELGAEWLPYAEEAFVLSISHMILKHEQEALKARAKAKAKAKIEFKPLYTYTNVPGTTLR